MTAQPEDRQRSASRALALAAVVPALLAAAVRLPGVYGAAFWQDEVASARILQARSFAGMLRRVGATESTPPLWYGIAWAMHALDVPLRDGRLLSVACGATTAAVTVLLAQRFAPLGLAATAGVMVALGGEFVFHGHELRAYALFALLAALLGLSVVRTVESPSRRRDAATAAIVAAGGSTHYFFAFSALSVVVWAWLDPRARVVRRRLTASVAGGGLVAAAWLPLMLRQLGHGRFSWIGPFRLRAVLAIPLRLFTYAAAGTPIGLVLSLLALAVLAVGCRRLASRPTGAVVGALAVGPIVMAAAVWRAGADVFDVRNLIGVGPFAAVAAASALEAISRRLAAATASAAAVGLLLALVSTRPGPDYDRLALALVREGWTARSPIVVLGPPLAYRSPLEWYLPSHPRLRIARALESSSGRLFLVRASGVRAITVAGLHALRHASLLLPVGSRSVDARRAGRALTGTN